MESRAAVLEAPEASAEFTESRPASIETIDVSMPGPEEVLVEIKAASLCHTDVAIARGHIDEQHPLVMGHEGAGVVREVGEGVTSVAPGDHVVLGRIACGTCEFCRQGKGQLCEERSVAKANGTLRNGSVRFRRGGEPAYHCHGVSSFSEATVVNEEVAIKITDEIPLTEATLLGCGVFTGVGAVANTADVEVGASVVVFGAGGVGLSAVQGAVLRGADEIVVVDVVPEKLDVARAVGATHTVDASEGEPVERIRESIGGVDYAFDVVGDTTVAEQALDVLKPTGTAVLVGIPPGGKQPLDVDIYSLVTGEQTLQGSFNGSYNLSLAIPKLADLVAKGDLSLDELITGSRPLSELNEAMAELESGTDIRQVILPE